MNYESQEHYEYEMGLGAEAEAMAQANANAAAEADYESQFAHRSLNDLIERLIKGLTTMKEKNIEEADRIQAMIDDLKGQQTT